jgi:hypothetical protein
MPACRIVGISFSYEKKRLLLCSLPRRSGGSTKLANIFIPFFENELSRK